MRVTQKICNFIFGGTLLLTSGCDPWAAESAKNQKRFDALDKVDRTAIPVGSEFIRFYPDAEIRYLGFSGSDFPGLSYDTTLFQRYTLNLQIPVFYSKDNATVTGFGDPMFYVLEVQKVVPTDKGFKDVEYGEQQFQFGQDEWKRLVAAGGDFAAIGHPLKKDQPVDGFELIKSEIEELSRKAQIRQVEAGAGQPAPDSKPEVKE